MKDLISLVIFTIEFIASVVATIADVWIKIFSPFSKAGHAIERWCERQRKKLIKPKETKKEEKPQEE